MFGELTAHHCGLGAIKRLFQVTANRPIIALAWLCVADLASTVWLLNSCDGGEANPLMGRFLAHGTGAFIVAKLALSILPLAVLKWARRYQSEFVHKASRAALAAYLILYMAGVVRANTKQYVIEAPADPRFIAAIDHARREAAVTSPLLSMRTEGNNNVRNTP